MTKRATLNSSRLRTPGSKSEPISIKQKRRPLKERAKQIIVYAHPDAHAQLKQLAASVRVQLNDLTVEALNLLFKARQLPQIALPDE